MKRFYIFKGNSKEENQEKVSNLSKADLKELNKFFRSIPYFPFVENGNEFAYTILSNEELEKIKNIFYSTELIFDFENITSDFLYSTEDTLSKLNEIFESSDKDEFDYSDFDRFIENVHSYIDINLTVDVVLDKISSLGVQNLNNFDKNILEKSK
jgi:hypothetical protein